MAEPKDFIDQMPQYRAKWDQLILSTEPVDKPKAEHLINQIYEQICGEHPQIIWVDSPWHPLTRTAKIYTRREVPKDDERINSSTFQIYRRKIILNTLKRLGLRKGFWGRKLPETIEDNRWLGIPQLALSPTSTGLISIMWRTEHAAFYYNQYHEFAFFDWCRNAVGLAEETHSAALAIELARCVPWWRPHDKICFVSERPTKLTFDNKTGPAITWGTKCFYMIDGVEVPDFVVLSPRKITTKDIVEEPNAEVRRIMINRYKSGIHDFLKDMRANRRDHDERYGTLWHIPAQNWLLRDMFYLEVVNRTPEPDGSFKHYFLRMPPFIDNGKGGTRWLNSSKEAYDWSFWGEPVTSSDMVES
jgi:hypothetical protein